MQRSSEADLEAMLIGHCNPSRRRELRGRHQTTGRKHSKLPSVYYRHTRHTNRKEPRTKSVSNNEGELEDGHPDHTTKFLLERDNGTKRDSWTSTRGCKSLLKVADLNTLLALGKILLAKLDQPIFWCTRHQIKCRLEKNPSGTGAVFLYEGAEEEGTSLPK
jgi:hypothetical protein